MKAIGFNTYLSRLALLSCAPLLALSLALSIDHVRSLHAAILSAAQNRTRDLAFSLDRHVEAQISALRMLSESPLIDDPSKRADFYTAARGFSNGFGAHVILADTDSNMLINTRVPYGTPLTKLPVPKGRAAAPEVLRTGKTAVGDSFIGPVVGVRLVSVVVPVLRQGRTAGLLLATVDVRQFQEFLGNLAFPASWTLRILDGTGTLIAERKGDSGVDAGDSAVQYSSPMANTGWTVSLAVPRSDYRRTVVREVAAWLGALVSALAAGYLVGKLYGRRLSAAVRALMAAPPERAGASPIVEIVEVRARLSDLNAEREESRRILGLFVENAPASIAMLDRESRVVAASRRFLQDCGLEGAEFAGKRLPELFPEAPPQWMDSFAACLEGRAEHRDADAFTRPGAAREWIRWELRPWTDSEGVVGGAILFWETITGRVESEERLRLSLKEKDVLLSELYHRTNNNMQRIEAMMALQAFARPDMPLLDFTRSITRKISAMALAHSMLVDSGDLSRVDLSAYLSVLARSVYGDYPDLHDRVSLDLRLEPTSVLFDSAVPIGLVALELLGNAFVHAFPDGRSGRVSVSLGRDPDGGIVLRIADDGIGLSPRDADHALGLDLVGAVVREQLKGSLALERGPGTAHVIVFTDSQYRARVP